VPTPPSVRPDLDAIEARAAAATPGPWDDLRVGWSGDPGVPRSYEAQLCNRDGTAVVILTHDGSTEAHANAAFVAHSRSDVPSLVAHVRRLEALLDRIGDALGQHPGESWDDLPAMVREVVVERDVLRRAAEHVCDAVLTAAAAEREACAAVCERMARELETVPMGAIRDAVARRDLAVAEMRRTAGRIRARGGER